MNNLFQLKFFWYIIYTFGHCTCASEKEGDSNHGASKDNGDGAGTAERKRPQRMGTTGKGEFNHYLEYVINKL